jgi:hypothetical protein
MRRQKQPQKRWTEMTTAQLREATREYDREIPLSETRPMTAKERADWKHFQALLRKEERAKRRLLAKASAVRLHVEPRLLARADDFAKRTGMTRDAVFCRGVDLLLRRAS